MGSIYTRPGFEPSAAYGREGGLPLVEAADGQEGEAHWHEPADQRELHTAQGGIGRAALATSSCAVVAIYLEPQEQLDDLLQHERPKGEEQAMQSLCCDNGAAAHFEQHERERDLRRPAHAGRPQQPGQPRRPGRQAEDYPGVPSTGSPQQSGDLLLRRKTRRAHASDFTHWRNLAPSIRNSPEQAWKAEEFRISDGRPPQSLFGAMLSLYSAVSGFASTPQGQLGCYCAPPAPMLPHNMTCTRALLLLSSPHAISPPIGFAQ